MNCDVIDLEVIEDQCFENILSLVHELTGITIGKNRKTMVMGRLRKRITTLAIPSYEDYVNFVKTNADEKRVFVDLLTTNETYFFRTPRIWDYLQDRYLPTWYEKNKGKTFHAWSAASSSGEEAYSLGVQLKSFKEKNPDFKFRILGTDISQKMIELCQRGVYQGRSLESFKKIKPELFSKHLCEVSPGEYSVSADIKSCITFQTHNLFRSLNTESRFDLILLRNVLIYFKSADQEKVLGLIYPKLDSKGVLIIGESESLSHINTGFSHIEPLIYSKATQDLG